MADASTSDRVDTPVVIWAFASHLEELREKLINLATNVTSLSSYISTRVFLIPNATIDLPSPSLPPMNPNLVAVRQQVAFAFATATYEMLDEELGKNNRYIREVCEGLEVLKKDHGGGGADDETLKGIEKIDTTIDELLQFFEEIVEAFAELPLDGLEEAWTPPDA